MNSSILGSDQKNSKATYIERIINFYYNQMKLLCKFE
jgi:hypothetical protein